MASLSTGGIITRVLAGVLIGGLAIFAAALGYNLITLLFTTHMPIGLTTDTNEISSSFTIYGFVSIEACFLGVSIALGYATLRNALKPKVIEVEVEH